MSNDATGVQFGTYRIERLIGRGAFASVYLAEDVRPQLRRKVALKVLSEEFSSDPVFRERFFRESLAVAGLGHHPNIVPVYDAGEDQGRLYIAMAFVEGGDFQARIDQQGILPVESVASIVTQVAAALDVAHRAGLVHRDVKPGNILLSGDGERAYLADFGLIKDLASSRALTVARGYLGTPYYSAPEQFEGATVGPGADIYALGAVTFHALAGTPAFAGSTESVIAGHLFKPVPSVSHQRPTLPSELDEVIAHAMAKKPEDRYPTAGDLASAISRVCDTATTRTWQPPPPPATVAASAPAKSTGRGLAVALAMVGLAVVVGVLALILVSRDDSSPNATPPSKETGSSGPSSAPQVAVPAVTGRPSDDAKRLLEEAGLTATVSSDRAVRSDLAAGVVVRTSPVATESVARGSRVVMVVSERPNYVWTSDLAPNAGERSLLRQLPGMLDAPARCRPLRDAQGQPLPDPLNIYPHGDDRSSIECAYGLNSTIVYSQFESDAELDAFFDDRLAGRRIADGEGTAGPVAPWQFDFRNDPEHGSGRAFGYLRTSPQIRSEVGWIRYGYHTYAYSYRLDEDFAAYYRWWSGVFGSPAPKS